MGGNVIAAHNDFKRSPNYLSWRAGLIGGKRLVLIDLVMFL